MEHVGQSLTLLVFHYPFCIAAETLIYWGLTFPQLPNVKRLTGRAFILLTWNKALFTIG